MRLGKLAAAIAAASLLAAGSADAAIVTSTLIGIIDAGHNRYGNFNVTLKYDTSRGSITNDPFDQTSLNWTLADGTPSPLLSISGSFLACTNCDDGGVAPRQVNFYYSRG